MNHLKLFLCTIATLFLTLLALFTALIWLPIRLFVQLLAKAIRNDLDGILEPIRAFMFRHEVFENPKFNGVCYLIYDGEISVELALELYAKGIGHALMTNPSPKLEYHRLRTSITTFCGYYFWKRNKGFKLGNHFFTYEQILQEQNEGSTQGLKLPVKAIYEEEDLKTIADFMSTRGWKQDQSPWEVIILNNFRSKGTPNSKGIQGNSDLQTVVFLRAHHVLGDGYSLVNLLAKFHCYEGKLCAVPTFIERTFWEKILWTILLPFRAFRDVVMMLYHSEEEQNDWINAPRDGKLSNSYITTWSPEIPVDRIKKLKKRFNVSFFAVLQSVSAGVMAKMMRSTGAAVPTVLRCFVPLPLPNHPLGLNIHAIFVMVELLTGETDPVLRLLKSHSSTLRLKDSIAPLVFLWFIRLLCHGPNFFIRRVIHVSGHTVGFSPFPGFASELKPTPEHVLRRLFCSVDSPSASSPVGSITSFTNLGNVIFAFSCRRHIINSRTQIEEFSQFLEEELHALEMDTS